MGNDKGHAVVKLRLQEHTNYYFDCKPAALHGALDRFSQFFVAPLCKADALEREVNAVDNEFSGVLSANSAYELHVLPWQMGVRYGKIKWHEPYSILPAACPLGSPCGCCAQEGS